MPGSPTFKFSTSLLAGFVTGGFKYRFVVYVGGNMTDLAQKAFVPELKKIAVVLIVVVLFCSVFFFSRIPNSAPRMRNPTAGTPNPDNWDSNSDIPLI